MGLSPGRVKPKTIKLVFVASPLNSQYSGERAKTGWFGIRIMCPYGVTYQSADCCFSELALSNYKNPNRRVGLVQCRHHRLIDINFWPWYNWKIAELALNNNHSLISSIYINYKKGCTRLAAASDKVYQLLAHGRWFSPGTPASSTCKTGLHDIAEILLKVSLNTKSQTINQSIHLFSWVSISVDKTIIIMFVDI